MKQEKVLNSNTLKFPQPYDVNLWNLFRFLCGTVSWPVKTHIFQRLRHPQHIMVWVCLSHLTLLTQIEVCTWHTLVTEPGDGQATAVAYNSFVLMDLAIWNVQHTDTHMCCHGIQKDSAIWLLNILILHYLHSVSYFYQYWHGIRKENLFILKKGKQTTAF